VEEGVWRLRKARSVLKLVALAPGHSLHRDQVIETLWPDRDVAAAANNLRQALFLARRAIDSCGGDGAAWLDLSQELLSLTPAADVSIDVEIFETAAKEAARRGDLEAYRAAVALYAGDLLPEDRFEEWARARREALRELRLGMLVELASLEEAAGDHAAAAAALQQVVVTDPMHEQAHRELMRLYALTGRRQRALSQYHVSPTSPSRRRAASTRTCSPAATGVSKRSRSARRGPAPRERSPIRPTSRSS
jgi:DNA-binding SARP family transcriptional activator